MDEAAEFERDYETTEFRVLSRVHADRVAGRKRTFKGYLEFFSGDEEADVAKILIEHQVFRKHGVAPTDDAEPGGRYVLLDKIGEGGDAEVFRARHIDHQGTVALKRYKNILVQGDRLPARVTEEAKRTALLDHPAIAEVRDVGILEGRAFIAMRYVEGQTLDDVFQAVRGTKKTDVHRLPFDGPDRIPTIARFFAKLARAVGYCHAKGLLHRDLSPKNVMVTAAIEPVILDFGVSKILAADTVQFTRHGDPIGTPTYVAPEVLRRNEYGPPVDVYAVGLLLFETLCGRPMFKESTKESLDRAILAGPGPEALQHIRALPLPLQVIVETAAAGEPTLRYRSAEALADDLEAFVDRRPIAARRPGLIARGRLWCARNRTVAVAGSIVIVLLAIATILSFKSARAEAKARVTDRARQSAVNEAARVTRQREAEKFIAAADAVAKQGNWNGALAYLDQARAMGHDDSVEVALAEVEYRWFADEKAASETAIRGLMDGKTNLGQHRGRALLLAGEITSDRSKNHDDGASLFRDAIASGQLSPADLLFARAMIAPSIPEVRRLLDEALSCDPLHLLANNHLGTILILMADHDSALVHATKLDTLMPRGREGQELRMMVSLIRGDRATADDARRKLLARGVRSEDLELVGDLLRVVGPMLSVDVRAILDSDRGVARRQKLQAESTALLSRAMYSRLGASSSAMRLRLPVALSRLLSPFLKPQKSMLDPELQAFVDLSRALMNDETIVDQSVAVWPDAMLFLLKGKLRYWKKDYLGAMEAADEAIRRPGLFDVRGAASMLYHLAFEYYSEERPDLIDAYRMRHREIARSILAHPDLELPYARTIFITAWKNESDPDLAAEAVERWCALAPDDPPARFRKIEVLMRKGRLFEAADELQRFEFEFGIPENFAAKVAEFRWRLAEPLQRLIEK